MGAESFVRELIFDLDGTLLRRWMEGNEDFSPIPLASPEKIRALGKPLAICSNQGGIAWNLAGGRPGKRYPSWPEVLDRTYAVG